MFSFQFMLVFVCWNTCTLAREVLKPSRRLKKLLLEEYFFGFEKLRLSGKNRYFE